MPVFISHCHEDQSSYTSLCLALDGTGVERWDPSYLSLGQPLSEQLRRAIDQCEVCIFLATRQSLKSRWCLAELGAFWGVGKRVIIYVADHQIGESDIPPQFQGNLRTNDARRLVEAVKETTEEEHISIPGSHGEFVDNLSRDGKETGVRRIFHHRLAVDVSHDDLNRQLGSGQVVNISSLVFNVRQSSRLKKSLKQCVAAGGQVRILLADIEPATMNKESTSQQASVSSHALWPMRLRQHAEKDIEHNRIPSELSTTLAFLDDLRGDLNSYSGGLQIRLLAEYVMYWSMMQIDENMLLTMYCNKEQGNGSPTLRLSRVSGERCLFSLFEGEYEYLWKKARPWVTTA